MHNGDIDRHPLRRRTIAGALILTVAGALAAGCTRTDDTAAPAPAGPAAPAAPPSSAPAATFFGPDRYGTLTLTTTEKEALAGGELQTEPVSTVLGSNVYAFVGGPKPDPSRMAADAKIEADVEKADDNGFGDSAAGSAQAAKAYADSTQRLVERLEAYLTAGGAEFEDGALTSIAAPPAAATEAGIKRGSTVAELTAAYGGKGLTKKSATAYELPVPGQAGWTMLFEVEKDAVKYMSLGRSGS